jgi:molybdate transport system substrate-binding protein
VRSMISRRTAAVLTLAASIAAASPIRTQSLSSDGETLTVFAAASLRNALDDANKAFTKATGIKVVASYAASSALAKQIAQGAPADVYFSANIKWMDYLEQKKLIKAGTRVNLLGNALALIAPVSSKLDKVKIAKGFDIAKLAGSGRIAVANVKAVPAGLYAKAALQSLGAWSATEPKLAQGEHVRTTLSYVVRGETSLGIVYSTDAKIERKVKIVGVFPDGSHPPIIYPVAATATAKGEAPASYLEFLQTPAAKAIFEKYGFTFMIKPVT